MIVQVTEAVRGFYYRLKCVDHREIILCPYQIIEIIPSGSKITTGQWLDIIDVGQISNYINDKKYIIYFLDKKKSTNWSKEGF